VPPQRLVHDGPAYVHRLNRRCLQRALGTDAVSNEQEPGTGHPCILSACFDRVELTLADRVPRVAPSHREVAVAYDSSRCPCWSRRRTMWTGNGTDCRRLDLRDRLERLRRGLRGSVPLGVSALPPWAQLKARGVMPRTQPIVAAREQDGLHDRVRNSDRRKHPSGAPPRGSCLPGSQGSRADAGDTTVGQPLTWTFIEFELDEKAADALATALRPLGRRSRSSARLVRLAQNRIDHRDRAASVAPFQNSVSPIRYR
jgi:hypothetical protein